MFYLLFTPPLCSISAAFHGTGERKEASFELTAKLTAKHHKSSQGATFSKTPKFWGHWHFWYRGRFSMVVRPPACFYQLLLGIQMLWKSRSYWLSITVGESGTWTWLKTHALDTYENFAYYFLSQPPWNRDLPVRGTRVFTHKLNSGLFPEVLWYQYLFYSNCSAYISYSQIMRQDINSHEISFNTMQLTKCICFVFSFLSL